MDSSANTVSEARFLDPPKCLVRPTEAHHTPLQLVHLVILAPFHLLRGLFLIHHYSKKVDAAFRARQVLRWINHTEITKPDWPFELLAILEVKDLSMYNIERRLKQSPEGAGEEKWFSYWEKGASQAIAYVKKN
ncbi:hypothetical protein F53441_7271 [Fusarium austroafricanum]|uniref:Uncharacterized protein n=1 Tax=Fusarium austroafricanum TaxID=2364996 RepID=A0A8H4NYM2_9HYPO|nr:hypothetical protein F53441_7271 [Fusarium austroafricanum]